MPAPNLVTYSDTAYNTAGGSGSKTTGSLTWASGDIIVVIAASEGAFNAEALTLPTATGLTFTSLANVQAGAPAAHAAGLLAFAVAGSSGSGGVTVTDNNAGSHFGISVWQFNGSNGVGNNAFTSSPSATRVVSLTPAGGADSAIVWGVFDWAAASTQSATPTPTNTRRSAVDGTAYTYYVFDLLDQPGTGAVNYGIGGSGTGPFTIFALEIEGTSGGSIVDEDYYNLSPAKIADSVITVF